MTKDTGRDIGNRIGNLLEADRRSWQSNQAKYMRATSQRMSFDEYGRGEIVGYFQIRKTPNGVLRLWKIGPR